MSAQAEPITTAGLRPELFAGSHTRRLTRAVILTVLALLLLAGFGLRATGLGVEALSDDELNKLQAVADYRANGLTGANGEHPFLMKALQAVSIMAAERWNETSLVAARGEEFRVPVETALRWPSAIFGALTVIVLYLLVAELFGKEVALIAAALWAFDTAAISFNRIAKEDTFLLFFFLLANVFWLRSQRVAESGKRNPDPLYWATAASFGAMLASKYVLHYLAVSISYYHIFQGIPATRWRMGKKKFLIFFTVMGAVFVLCNPTILLPETWRQMQDFASYKRIGHDGYEFMGTVYRHRFADWLNGVPWYYYFVFMAVKLPLATLAAFLVGLPLAFRRRLGDGRFFLLFWTLIGFMPFVLVGGKFTRYFTPALPIVLIVAAIGLQTAGQWAARKVRELDGFGGAHVYAGALLPALVVLFSLWTSVSASPHYRLYTNLLGGGQARAGDYFPQDEFYDAGIRDIMEEIARRAPPGARVATETPGLAAYYAERAGRTDLVFVSLSDPEALKNLAAGDFIVAARGRRYFSNDALLTRLRQSSQPAFSISVGRIHAADIYILDQASQQLVADTRR